MSNTRRACSKEESTEIRFVFNVMKLISGVVKFPNFWKKSTARFGHFQKELFENKMIENETD